MSGSPGLAVEDVLLQESEERLHRGVVTTRPDPAHRAAQPVTFECFTEFPRPELGSSVRMHDHPGRLPPVSHGHLECVDRDPGLHPRVDRVTHDPVGEHIFDRTQVHLSLSGAVLGDVGEPQLVGPLSGELPLHQVIMDRRTCLLVARCACDDDRLDTGDPAQPPHTTLRDRVTQLCDVIGQHSVAAFRIIGVEFA